MYQSSTTYKNLSLERRDNVFILTLQKPPENRLNTWFCQEIIRALDDARKELGRDSEGALIIRGNDTKFFCTGLDLYERDTNPYASSEGFYPLVHAILDFPFPTICLITGHVFGGASLMSLAHDYRIMNAERGYWCMPVADLGLHFNGMGTLLRSKLSPQVARKVLLQGHRFKSSEALADGIIDEIAHPAAMLDRALALANRVKSKARTGVYGLLRNELYGEAIRAFQQISYVHTRIVAREAKVKL
ncbi:hypothetical protein LCI18_014059 [Fusarium solani-melongenae]|uniref:Uncharacterized protein n=1 Tax=Fusarium solani subsp. cucurbitae TaxID=2747967 RepID=A0ACD3ZP74_FUSSC|nr:hypothetical protein LCI18_014059 [Fusarium solani-melongenae]